MGEREFTRSARVAEQFQRELAEMISRDLDDPRLNLVTVSGVRISRDLANARVSITVPLDGDVKEAVRALNRAAGFLTKRLAARIRLRQMPRLRFVHDDELEQALRVDALLEEVRAKAPPGDDTGSG